MTGWRRPLPPNPRMQPTGRRGAKLRSGHSAPQALLWNVGLCGGEHREPAADAHVVRRHTSDPTDAKHESTYQARIHL